MRKKMLSFVLLTSMLLTLFTGCTSQPEGKALVNALLKTNKVTSVEAKGSLKINVDAQGLPAETQTEFNQFKPLIDGTEVKYVSKVSQRYKGKSLKTYSKVTSESLLFPLNIETWMDYNATGKKPVSKQIVKSPDLVGLLSSKHANKYVVITDADLKKNPEISQSLLSSDLTDMISNGRKDNEKFLKFLLKNPAMFSNSIAVTNGGNATVNGATVKVYKVKLTDAGLKSMLREGLKNKDFMNLMKEFILSNMSAAGLTAAELKEAKAAINETFNQLQSAEGLAEIDEVLNKFDAVPLLGEKGIDLTISVDNKGYIVKETGIVQILLDLEKLEQFIASVDSTIENPTAGLTGQITLGITYNIQYSNINGRVDKNIIFPNLKSSNSVKLSTLVEPPAPKVTVKKSKVKVFSKKNYVKVTDITSPLKGKSKYSKGNLNISVKGKTIKAKNGSKSIYVDGKKQTLKTTAIKSYKGNTYVPVELFTKAGIKVNIK